MSNFFLCDMCEYQHDHDIDYFNDDNMCNVGEIEPKVMVDHHGVNGRRYDDPNEVCPPFKRRESEHE